jgi:hypothetical protein
VASADRLRTRRQRRQIINVGRAMKSDGAPLAGRHPAGLPGAIVHLMRRASWLTWHSPDLRPDGRLKPMGGQLQDRRKLAREQMSQKHDFSIGKLDGIMVGIWIAQLDLPKATNLVADRGPALPACKGGEKHLE